jgi:hypothetical protein
LADHRHGGVLGVAVGADLVGVGLVHRRAPDHDLHPVAQPRLLERVDGALHRGHGRGHQRGDAHDLGRVLLDRGHELLGSHVPAQVDHLEAGAFEHHRHQVLADVVQVALGGADHHHPQVLTGAARLGDERLEQIEPRVHRPRREQHLGDVVLVAPELLADHVHAGNQPAEDQVLRVHREGQPFMRLLGDRVLVAQDEGARHHRIVEALVGHRFTVP